MRSRINHRQNRTKPYESHARAHEGCSHDKAPQRAGLGIGKNQGAHAFKAMHTPFN